MKYMGSKARVAKCILPIVLKDRTPNQWYIEPFVGGANVIDKVDGLRIGIDSNKYLIALLKALSEGWLPRDDYTEEEYKRVKNNKENCPDHIVGYFGICLSYSGKWFGGWCRDPKGKRNYPLEAYDNVRKQAPLLEGVEFIHSSFLNFTTGVEYKGEKVIRFLFPNITCPMILLVYGKKNKRVV